MCFVINVRFLLAVFLANVAPQLKFLYDNLIHVKHAEHVLQLWLTEVNETGIAIIILKYHDFPPSSIK